MCSALEGVAGMVPPSYHPPSAADWQAALAAQQEVLEQLQGLVAALDGALDRLGQQEQQQHQQQQQQAMMGNAAADRVHLTEDQAHAAAGAWVTAGTTACATTREAAASKDGVAGAMGQVVQQKLIVLQCWLLRRVLWQLVGCLALLQQAVTELVGSMVGAPKPVVA
jgi:TolA-binding protein